MGYTIDIDTGGTFTDGFVVCGSEVRTVKVATTPHDLTLCFLECIAAGAKAFGVSAEDFLFDTEIIRFSNTIGTNTIIERNGAKIGLLLSEGMEGLAPTANEGKASLVEPDMVMALAEQVDEDGTVITEPSGKQVLQAAQTLIDRGARGLVVCFANSEHNPASERRVRQIIKREYPRDYLGSVSVFLSSDISPRSGLAERLNSAVLNAYIHPKLARLLYKAGEDLRQRHYRNTLFIGHNNASVARVAKTRAINTYNSGPAAGLLGAREIGQLYGIENLISTDMGGTSFDIGYVRNGQASYALEPDVEGFPCNLPMMSILALGTGGGSIAHLENGELRVGPQSAGALPGPACFNLGGTQPTVTDANLVLGVLDPDFFLGGSMQLDVEKAQEVIKRDIADPMGLSVSEAAWQIKLVVDAQMGAAVSRVADKLHADADPVVVAYGGAGGLHACDIASASPVRKIIMTPFSAVSSAFSSSLLDVGHLYYQRINQTFTQDMDSTSLQQSIDDMMQEAVRDMRGEGFTAEMLSSELQLFIQAKSGGQELLLHAPTDFYQQRDSFDRVIAQAKEALVLAGEDPEQGVQLVTVALMVRAPVPHFVQTELSKSEVNESEAIKSTRPLYVASAQGYVDAPIYDRTKLGYGAELKGPALVESDQTTILVPENWELVIDKYDNCILEEVQA